MACKVSTAKETSKRLYQDSEEEASDASSENFESGEEWVRREGTDTDTNTDDEDYEPGPPSAPPSSARSPRAAASPRTPKAKQRRLSITTSEAKWKNREVEDELPRQFPFCPRRTPGSQLDPQKDYNPKELFQLFFSKDVLNTLCQNTNKNIRRKRSEGLRSAWFKVDPDTIMRFISLVIYAGLMKTSALRDLWRKDSLHSFPLPPSVMPGWKFAAIMSFLHMSDPEKDKANDELKGKPGYDPFFRTKSLLDQILASCRAYYHPFQNISIDERTAAAKSHHSLKNKPIKWGFKLFVLTDCRNGYTYNFRVYQGKSLTPSGNGLSFDAVVNLIHVRLLGTGYHLYMDNLYMSAVLFKHLWVMNYGACGTIQEARIGYPNTNSLPKDAERGDMRWIRDDVLLFVKWKDTREITMCSTIHKAYSEKTVVRRLKNRDGGWSRHAVPVPDPVLDYNENMAGVDLSDALIRRYTVSHKTKRWCRKLFMHFVDIAVVNSFILYKEHALAKKQDVMTEKSFRERLCMELAACGRNTSTSEEPPPPQPQPKSPVRTPPGCLPVPVVDISTSNSWEKATKGRKYCVHCRSQKKLNRTIFKCRSCNVALCIIPDRLCFTEWHKKKQQTERHTEEECK